MITDEEVFAEQKKYFAALRELKVGDAVEVYEHACFSFHIHEGRVKNVSNGTLNIALLSPETQSEYDILFDVTDGRNVVDSPWAGHGYNIRLNF